MKDEYGGQTMKELLASTLAHEAMHAYFDRQGHDRFPYVIRVEEPLAEFGMLLYLHETKQRHYFHWARIIILSFSPPAVSPPWPRCPAGSSGSEIYIDVLLSVIKLNINNTVFSIYRYLNSTQKVIFAFK